MRQFNRVWLLVVMGLVLFSIGLHALRWQLLLKPLQSVPLPVLFEAIILGRFTNLILPLNVGSLVQAYRIKQRYNLSLFTTMGTLTAEGIIGSFVLWAFSLGVLLNVPLPTELAAIRQQIWLGLGIITLGLILILLILFSTQRSMTDPYEAFPWLNQFVSPARQRTLSAYWQRFRQGLSAGRNWRETALILFYSLGIRLNFGLAVLCIARGFGVELPYLTYLFLDILVSLVHIIGSHVFGLIGTLEATLTYALSLYGIPKETGLGIALMLDAAFILPVATLGLIFFWRSDLTWQTVIKLRKQRSA